MCAAANIQFLVEDVKKYSFPRSHYDLVLVFFYLERTIFLKLFRTLRPGGLLLYKTYTREQRKFGGGPTHPMHLLKTNELLQAFSRLQILFYRETVRERGIAEVGGNENVTLHLVIPSALLARRICVFAWQTLSLGITSVGFSVPLCSRRLDCFLR